ncbi:MAG: photosystem II reaction center protein J [Synechococcales cyanobacterium RM1_1_8]|nr:photosystem II reaction center protein J [Synechococcales cyanobacterium RM1_1_8]
MLSNGRIPIWLVALVAGTGALVVVGIFFYGAYVGVGSAT